MAPGLTTWAVRSDLPPGIQPTWGPPQWAKGPSLAHISHYSLQTIFVPINFYDLKSYLCPHLTDGETEAQKVVALCSR